MVTEAIAQTVRDLKLNSDYQARVRLTGLAPMNDDQFATIKDNAPLNAVVSIVAVFIILWLALRAARIILAVAVTLVVGLAISAAFGLLLVGALNVISVAFVVVGWASLTDLTMCAIAPTSHGICGPRGSVARQFWRCRAATRFWVVCRLRTEVYRTGRSPAPG